MQSQNSVCGCLLEAVPHDLLEPLQDIVQNVQIEPNFRISHPTYKSLELPAEVAARFQHMPTELQYKYLNLQLQQFLYGIYYNGSLRETLTAEVGTTGAALSTNLKNSTFLGIDLEFYERVHHSNCGKGYFDGGWQVIRQERDGSLAVMKNGLTLHIERDCHLKVSEQSAAIGDVVAIQMPKNLIQNGFYVAVGNAESTNYNNHRSSTVRVYCHLIPEGAIALMSELTQRLNELNIPFHFKVLYNPDDYKRYDSGVLYFERSDYPTIRQVLQTVYVKTQFYFRTQIPLFTKLLAPGLAVAEEPDYKFSEKESFGMNRCQIVASSLLQAWHRGESSPAQRLAAILQGFSLLGVNLKSPFLNINSEDIYIPLN